MGEVNTTPPKATGSSPRNVTPKKRKTESDVQPDTPYVVSHTHGDLPERRQALISSLPEAAPELPLDVFISHLLPKVGISDAELKKVQKKVHGRLYDSKQKAWPLGNSLKEVKDFEGFGTLQANIVGEAEKVPESDWAFHKTKPDGGVYFRTHATATQLHWKITCRVDEYKVRGKDKDKDDDIGKVIWSMHYVLAQDIARRFTFGLTIEDREARLYFACRAFLAVSEEFNINEKWEDFVDITLAFGLANQEQLGWDSTIGVSEDDFTTITVQNITYKITETLSDVQSLSILGRATRVFAVKDPNGEERVIKDVWVDDSRRREYDIQKAVIEDLTKTGGGTLTNRFFTHVGYEDVTTSDKRVDSTIAFSQNAQKEVLNLTDFHKRFALRRPITFALRSAGVGHILSHHQSVPTPGSLQQSHNDANRIGTLRGTRRWSDIPLPRVHHRLIIKERGTPLLNVLQISTCISILRQLVDLIFLLANASWVHRDLSVCNIYSVNGKLKLGDLEYAKKFGQESESGLHDLRTGTRWFWSNEIENGNYAYMKRGMHPNAAKVCLAASAAEPNLQDIEDQEEKEIAKAILAVRANQPGAEDPAAEKEATVTPVPPPLTHNPLHELESAWWLLLYIFAMRQVEAPSPDWDRSIQSKQLDGAFPSVNFAHRVQIFPTNVELSNLTDTFDLQIREKCFQGLETIRFTLVEAFVAAESTLPESIDATQWSMKRRLYTVFGNSLKTLQLDVWPTMKQWAVPTAKRRRISATPAGRTSSPTRPTRQSTRLKDKLPSRIKLRSRHRKSR